MLFSSHTILLFSVLIAGFSEQGANGQSNSASRSYSPAPYQIRSGTYTRGAPISKATYHANNKANNLIENEETEDEDTLSGASDDNEGSGYGGKFRSDAESSNSLISLLKKEFSKAKTQKGKPNKNNIRPFRASASVVNKAIKVWSNDQSKVACDKRMNIAIFDDPPRCMSNPSLPSLPTEIFAKKSNLVRRASYGACTYLTVVCLPENFERMTSRALIQEIDKAWKSVSGQYWSPPAICGPRRVVEKAWEEWNAKYLRGKKGVKFNGSICGKPSYESGINQGRIYAGFGKPSFVRQQYSRDHLLVECID